MARPKQPYFIHAADGANPLGVGGLWEPRQDATGQTQWSCTLITTPAGEALRSIHDRQPLVLPLAAWPDWLHRPVEQAGAMLHALDTGFAAHAVSRAVGNVRNTGAELIDAVTAQD
ncbi:MAG: SOS response-associated peptidase [Gammaproteobacteria bacterium]|nr:SOS response-associated peptidase [Gammaproteobacteria bacterium]